MFIRDVQWYGNIESYLFIQEYPWLAGWVPGFLAERPGKRPNYWTDFDALLHTNHILVSDVPPRIFFQKSQKMWKRCTNMHISGFTPYIPQKICKTTGPILMPFCIRTTYWSPTCLHVFFFKNLKKWQPCTHICIFCILPDNSKTTQPDLTRFHI